MGTDIVKSVDTRTLPATLDAGYRAMAADPKYEHFMNIPMRLIRCLDHFGVEGDREQIRSRLQTFYLFIGVVDHAIDSGETWIGFRVLRQLENGPAMFDDAQGSSNVDLITQVLSGDIHDNLIVKKFRRLYYAVLCERAATSIESYIRQRRIVGSLTADLSYQLIGPLLTGNVGAFRRFMRQVGAAGCLVDSVIDLRADRRSQLLSFKPTRADYLSLWAQTARHGLKLCLRYPQTLRLFFAALIDNLRDTSRSQLAEPRVGRAQAQEVVARAG
jgi:hypothetical protein